MQTLDDLFQTRARRLVALSGIGQIALEGFSQCLNDSNSKFKPHFDLMTEHLPSFHQTLKEFDVPLYRVVGFFDGLTLIASISEVEAYFQDLISEILHLYPKKIGEYSLDIQEIMDMKTINEAIEFVILKYSSELMFKKPNDYKKDLLKILSADKNLLDDVWPTFIEAKARRDIGVHNNWRVNDIYNGKLRDVKLPPNTSEVVSVDFAYMQKVRVDCIEIMSRLYKHCIKKFK